MPRKVKSWNATNRRAESTPGRAAWSWCREHCHPASLLHLQKVLRKGSSHCRSWDIQECEADHPTNALSQQHRGPAEGTGHLWSSVQTTFPQKAPPSLLVMDLAANPGSVLSAHAEFFPKGENLTAQSQMDSVPNTPGINQSAGINQQELISRLPSRPAGDPQS